MLSIKISEKNVTFNDRNVFWNNDTDTLQFFLLLNIFQLLNSFLIRGNHKKALYWTPPLVFPVFVILPEHVLGNPAGISILIKFVEWFSWY